MATLNKCSAASNLSKEDKARIRDATAENIRLGDDPIDAATNAVNELLNSTNEEKTNVVSQIKEQGGSVEPVAPVRVDPLLFQDIPEINTETGGFKRWSEDGEIVEPEDVNDYDFRDAKPVVLKVFHGTTHKFSVFDARRGNLEGQFGAINYFTSSEYDAARNYAGEGPDLTARIEQRAEQLQQRLEDQFEEKGRNEVLESLHRSTGDLRLISAAIADMDDADAAYEAGLSLARHELSGGEEITMELFVRVENPFVIGENAEWIEFIENAQIEKEAIEQVAENEGVEASEVENNRDEYEDQIDEARWDIEADVEHSLVDAIQAVSSRYDIDAAELSGAVHDLGSEATPEAIEALLRGSEDYIYAEDPETGELFGNQLIAEVIEEMGFDSIILRNAEDRFKNMDMDPGTAHIHIFDSNKTNIKSVENIGTFDPTDPDIFMQDKRGAITREAPFEITLTEKSDLSTFLHETGHMFLSMEEMFAKKYGITEDNKTILDWLGVESFEQIEVKHHEQFADGFLNYLSEGKAPSRKLANAFAAFKRWLIELYRRFAIEKVEVSDEVRGVFDRMLATQQEIDIMKSEGIHSQFFESKEQAGMSKAEWDKYQERIKSAENKSTETLDEKLVRELRRKTEKEWKSERRDIIDVEIEYLESTPLYKAENALRNRPADRDLVKEILGIDKIPPRLNGLTRKGVIEGLEVAPYTPEKRKSTKEVDPVSDSLIMAIGKLGGISQSEAEAQGIDPAEWKRKGGAQSGVFGKPWIRKDGDSLDGMAEKLSQYGYVEYDANKLLDLIDQELAGNKVYTPEGYEAIAAIDAGEMEAVERARVAEEGGEDFNSIALDNDFSSTHEMLSEILHSLPIKKQAAENADQKMLDKYGDILNDGTIEEEARIASQNEEQGKLILAELRALNKKAGGKREYDLVAIKLSAEEAVSEMAIKDIQPNKYYRAEIKAAKKASELLAKKDFDGARNEKAKQLANQYMYRAARDAKESAEKQRNYLRKVETRKYSSREVEPTYIEQMKILTKAYDFRKGKVNEDQAKAELLKMSEWLDAQIASDDWVSPSIIDPNISMLNAIMKDDRYKDDPSARLEALKQVRIKPFDEMTVSELKGVHDMVKNLRYVGGLLSRDSKAAFDEKARQVSENIEEKAKKDIERPQEETMWTRTLSRLREFGADHISLANTIAEMDGYEDFGPMFESFYQGIIDSSNHEIKMKRETTEKLREIFSGFKWSELKEGEGVKTVDLDSIQTGQPPSKLRTRFKGTGIRDGKWSLSTRGRVMLALYWGSPESRQAILDGYANPNTPGGYPLTDQHIQAMLDQMTERELDFVESIWALNESFWPNVRDTAKKMTGVAPPKVSHLPFAAAGRKMSGGYQRLFYMADPRDSYKILLEDEARLTRSGGHVMLNTAHGARHERVGSGGRRVDLNINNIFRALEENIHDIAFAETARNSNRLLSNRAVQNAIYNKYGKERYDALVANLEGVIAGSVAPKDFWSSAMRNLRINATYAFLGYSIRNFVQQPIALTNAFGKIGEMPVIKAVGKVYFSPRESVKFVQDRSEFMKNRTNLVNRDIAEITNRLARGRVRGAFMEHAFSAQTFGDAMVAYPIWLAAYNEALKKYTEEKARTLADEAVSATVGSGLMKDLSPIMAGTGPALRGAGPELIKSITFMGSFFNKVYQLSRDAVKTADFKTVRGTAKFTREMTWYLMMPAVLSALVVGELPDADDDEGWAEFSAKAIADYGMAQVFLLRDAASLAKGFTPSTSYTSALEQADRTFRIVGDIAEEEKELDLETAAKLTRGISAFVPVPGSYQAARMLEYTATYEEEGEYNIYHATVRGKER